jgi:iron complex transport system substrate-binding protein
MKIKLCYFCVLLLCLFGCNEQTIQSQQALTYEDCLQRKVDFKKQPLKVLGLAPSSSEMLAVLCDSQDIVGRTPYCNFPKYLSFKPVVNNYPLNFEALIKLKPDMVLTSEGMLPVQEADKLASLGMPVYFQCFKSVDDIPRGLRTLGTILGKQVKANRFAGQLETQIDSLRNLKTVNKPSVLLLIGADPIYVYGVDSYASDLLVLASAKNVITDTLENPFPMITREYLLKLNPDYILSDDSLALHQDLLKLYPELKQLKAFQKKHLGVLTDDLISRPGPRLVQAASEIHRLLHDE